MKILYAALALSLVLSACSESTDEVAEEGMTNCDCQKMVRKYLKDGIAQMDPSLSEAENQVTHDQHYAKYKDQLDECATLMSEPAMTIKDITWHFDKGFFNCPSYE